MRESLKILQPGASNRWTPTPVGRHPGRQEGLQHRVPAGEAYARVETPKGELGYLHRDRWRPEPVSLSRPLPIVHQPDRAEGDDGRPESGRRGRDPRVAGYRAGRGRPITMSHSWHVASSKAWASRSSTLSTPTRRTCSIWARSAGVGVRPLRRQNPQQPRHRHRAVSGGAAASAGELPLHSVSGA